MEAVARRAVERGRVAMLDLTREYQSYRQELLGACERVFSRMHLLGGEEVRSRQVMPGTADAKVEGGVLPPLAQPGAAP